MKQAIDAVFENGIFRPLQRDVLQLPDGQHVRITIDDEGLPETLRLAAKVYEGLSSDQIDDIEQIALERGDFFRGRRSGE